MRNLILSLILALAAHAQATNAKQTGILDAGLLKWIPPTSTFASPPSSPVTGSVYVFTDALSTGQCTGGGSGFAICRWSGSVWQSVGGGAPSSYACTVTAVSSIACTHNLGSSAPVVVCYDNSSPPSMMGAGSINTIVATSSSVVTITFSGTTTGVCTVRN